MARAPRVTDLNSSRSHNHQFGFQWGRTLVSRLAEIRGRQVIGIRTDHRDLEVVISPTGRRIQVHLDGRELR